MLKLTFCLHRLPTLSRAEFHSYWRDRHAPLVLSHAEALKIRRYVQLHTEAAGAISGMLRQSRGGPVEYDGVAELWWNSLADLEAAFATEAGRAAGAQLLEDERRFIDLRRSPLFLGEEHVIL